MKKAAHVSRVSHGAHVVDAQALRGDPKNADGWAAAGGENGPKLLGPVETGVDLGFYLLPVTQSEANNKIYIL